ncbi:AzlD domain-containing protein [Methylobrevis albus]|uniref:AzlD domain-containing protein n=1 Tax=Methylobrevis albus TaxID=2793297 RepID=A0A931I3Y5_9HYPH|nr:AzlD domain-containing protein [Methylobrevis albus]MBH0239807.1 AzlD domain-containing protein [Methylobrevis albus]
MPGYSLIDAPWWHLAFVILAGALPTHIWRWLGVAFGTRLDEDSETMRWVRAVATALVAAVVARLVLYPQGMLAEVPALLRLVALLGGFAAYLTLGRKVIVGVLVGEALLLAAMLWTLP